MPSGEVLKTLYQRMGGYEVIAGVIDDCLSRFRSDPGFARRQFSASCGTGARGTTPP